ncbi:MAG: hypothetical protein CL543_02975 [Alcanivorax sp.]|nr:hypothetical protein [Alcanivorax sp.]UWN51962.1 HTH-type transcriptional regulator YiaJ [Alcanivorax sp. ALC70]MAY12052.1 hypothetical protein [Alcanivorax sp.]MBI56090.1 hypothetical protein [Alcanivorax sp.]MBU57816.1 hypothetical protein [Alcanivorax sp.]|tara:strand:- start:965 stop:1756 length:792 start_codon:yes stop_codon:yes gene_type:complete
MKTINALARGLRVVATMNDANAPLSLGELHARTGIDRATILRILATLESEGWVFRGLGDKRYRLSYKLHDLGTHVSIGDAIAHAAAPVLEQLQRVLEWPSDISVYDGDCMSIIETSRRNTPFLVNREVVGYRPNMLESAMGRVYFAFSDERRRRLILERVSKKGGREAQLAADAGYIEHLVRDVREKGYALRDPECYALPVSTPDSFNAIAVPVLVLGEVQASLNMVWIETAYKGLRIEDFFYDQLKLAAAELAQIFQEHGLY